MRIAVPVANGRLAVHFGHCEEFAILDVDMVKKAVTRKQLVKAPPHEPGLLPRWLAEKGVTTVIAGGMGQRARAIFEENNIRLAVGAGAQDPESLALSYVNGTLETGPNVCDH